LILCEIYSTPTSEAKDEARTAIVDLLKTKPEWRSFFKQGCEKSAQRLHSQTRQWQDELAYRGHNFALADVENALEDLVRRFFPETPGAQWDAEPADEMCKDALVRLGEHYAGLSEDERDRLDLSDQEPREAAMLTAGEENDPAAFRMALKAWERTGLEALERARERDGAA
jgi:hypothetical protein